MTVINPQTPVIGEGSITEEKLEPAQRMLRANIEAQQSIKPAETTDKNFVLGSNAGVNLKAKGEANVLLGDHAGEAVTTGVQNVCVGTGAAEHLNTGKTNVFIGNNAGEGATTAIANVVIGSGAVKAEEGGNFTGSKNVVIGGGAATALTSATGCIVIGAENEAITTTAVSKLSIGNNAAMTLIQGVMSATEASQEIGFLGHAPAKRPKVKGKRSTEAAEVLKTLCKGLAELGLITDETEA